MLKHKASPQLLVEHYNSGLSMSEIGRLYGVTRQRVHQVLKDAGLNTKASYTHRVRARFFAKVNKTKSCWVWGGTLTPLGYGRFTSNGKAGYAHRFSLSLLEPLNPKLDIDHLCRNRACVNPSHLEQVTRKTNLLRAPKHIVHGDFRK